MLNLSKSVLIKKQTHLHLEWPKVNFQAMGTEYTELGSHLVVSQSTATWTCVKTWLQSPQSENWYWGGSAWITDGIKYGSVGDWIQRAQTPTQTAALNKHGAVLLTRSKLQWVLSTGTGMWFIGPCAKTCTIWLLKWNINILYFYLLIEKEFCFMCETWLYFPFPVFYIKDFW